LTGLNAPLYGNENDTAESAENNQDWSVSYWIKKGCPPHKLVLGLPAYGRTFALRSDKENGLMARSYKNGTSGNFTKTAGFLAYYEICQIRKSGNWTNIWHSQSKSHYMYNKNDWISYDDIKSFHLRVIDYLKPLTIKLF
jgi:GH18 family chitinase